MPWLAGRELASASSQDCRLDKFDGGDEAIATSGHGCHVAMVWLALSQRFSKCRDMNFEVAVLDGGVWPRPSDQLVLADQLARTLDQGRQDFQGTTAKPDGSLAFQQALLSWQEAERAKRKCAFGRRNGPLGISRAPLGGSYRRCDCGVAKKLNHERRPSYFDRLE